MTARSAPLGFVLSLTTAVCWGVLPIALKIVLQQMDPYTITWYRLAVSTVILGAILAGTRRLPNVARLNRGQWWLVIVALVGLIGNYLLYLMALGHTTPAVAQTVIQLSPLFLLIAGIVIHRESFSPLQRIGLAALIVGLLLFFNRRLPELVHPRSGLGLGVVLLIGAALLWTAYALAQKELLGRLRSQQILWIVYVGATVALLPSAQVGELGRLSALTLWLLVFCCANTLIAYGAFAEALQHWEVSRISAVIATAPLFTLVGMHLVNRLAPDVIEAEHLTGLTVGGALLVVAGSVLSAFGRRVKAKEA